MEFIQNTKKGSQLDTLSVAASKSAESVIAAVAYVTDTRSLIDSCWKAQRSVDSLWRDQALWRQKSILNTARAGWFSSDRTIREYASEIWDVPLPEA